MLIVHDRVTLCVQNCDVFSTCAVNVRVIQSRVLNGFRSRAVKLKDRPQNDATSIVFG